MEMEMEMEIRRVVDGVGNADGCPGPPGRVWCADCPLCLTDPAASRDPGGKLLPAGLVLVCDGARPGAFGPDAVIRAEGTWPGSVAHQDQAGWEQFPARIAAGRRVGQAERAVRAPDAARWPRTAIGIPNAVHHPPDLHLHLHLHLRPRPRPRPARRIPTLAIARSSCWDCSGCACEAPGVPDRPPGDCDLAGAGLAARWHHAPPEMAAARASDASEAARALVPADGGIRPGAVPADGVAPAEGVPAAGRRCRGPAPASGICRSVPCRAPGASGCGTPGTGGAPPVGSPRPGTPAPGAGGRFP